MRSVHRFYFSEEQKNIRSCVYVDLKPHYVMVNGVWNEYTEWCSMAQCPNFKDAILVCESDDPLIKIAETIKTTDRNIILVLLLKILIFNNNLLYTT